MRDALRVTPDLRPDTLGDHVDRLYRAAWALCGSREDAEDLVQETFARVLARKREIGTDDPLPYLMRVLRNTFVSGLRTRDRRPRTAALEEDSAPFAAPSSGEPQRRAEANEVFAAIAELPIDYRDVVAAVDVAGLSYQEAADSLGIPVGTVMSRLYRGRGRVADRVGAA
jgi:RNA polymerase sigma-70 factor (ECF subfamily)